ncbi:MAG TPA: ScbA/BarX family gamma-butyrolactone biosynthesis protein, partial [Pseudonocardiaceae bacterium]|nr:ScbA/BarX family gamma-butyrolactone biosynthesis protein [Pseudonocardiaceae bacterium]
IRQAGILLAHTEYGVPLGQHFLVRDLHVAVRREHFLVGDVPASLDIDVACSDIKRRSGSLVELRIDVVIRRDGHVAATGGGSLRCVSEALYRRLRGDRAAGNAQLPLTAPVAPQSVGRMSPTDVVLSPTCRPDRWQLRVDTRHPVLFDHPVDHVPGMVLLEAARQAAAATLESLPFVPTGVSSEFERYVELDTPCFIEAQRVPDSDLGQESILVTGRQEDNLVFRCLVTACRDGG